MIKWFKKVACCFGWHSFMGAGYEYIGFDGCSARAKCRWCGYEGLIDSQGNLF